MRRTYHYDPSRGQLVEGPSPPRSAGSGDGWKYSDRLYSEKPFKAHDGTVIDSKRKHRAYMARHNLTTHDDFKGVWDEAARTREDIRTGSHDRAGRIEDIRRAVEKHRG